MAKIRIFFIIIILFIFVFSYSDEEKNIPESTTEFLLNSKSTIFRDISESNTEFEIKKSDSNSIDSMSVKVDLYRDGETKKQSAGFSLEGEKITNKEKINIGGEWNIPVFLYKNSNENNSAADIGYKAAAVSLGFVAKNTNKEFPFKFSAGPSFEGGLRQQQRDTIFGAGGYFSIIGGDSLGSRIAQSPFWFGSEIFGRYIKSDQNNRNTAAKSILIYDKNGIFATDSLTITVNNTIDLGEVNSQFAYINTASNREIPNKYANNTVITIRATQIGNAFLEPSFEISAIDNRYRYLNTDNFYGSLKKNTISALAFLNKELGNWDIETGIRFSGTREENSYFSDNSTKNNAGTASDTLNEKLKNANVFNPQYYFSARFLSPKEITLLSARFAVERNRRTFPFSYETNGTKISNNGDFDNVSQQIKLQSDFYLTNWYNLYLSAERLKYQIYFLKSQRSAGSRTEERFALELGNIFSRDSSMIFSVRGIAVATPQEYYFSDFDGVSLPSHNRSFGANADLLLNWRNGWANTMGFSVTKFDAGVIDGDYYGIENKNREIISSISLSKSTKFFVAAGGFEAKTTQTQSFDYTLDNYKDFINSYLLSPFIYGSVTPKDNFSLDFSVKRNIITGNLQSNNFWDISLNLSAYF